MLRLVLRVVLGAALALALALPSGAVTAWDQAKVTALAKQLSDNVDNLREAIRQSPQWTQPGARTILYRIRDNLRWIENEAEHLYADLAKGSTMEETTNSYRRIQFLKRDTEALAQQVQVTDFTRPALEKSQATLKELASYYPPEAANP